MICWGRRLRRLEDGWQGADGRRRERELMYGLEDGGSLVVYCSGEVWDVMGG